MRSTLWLLLIVAQVCLIDAGNKHNRLKNSKNGIGFSLSKDILSMSSQERKRNSDFDPDLKQPLVDQWSDDNSEETNSSTNNEENQEPESFGNSALSRLALAVQRSDVQLAMVLINGGANVNEMDNDGNTFLHLATSSHMINMLLHHGANPEQLNRIGQSPFIHQLWSLRLKPVITLLQNNGANVNEMYLGKSSVYYFCEKGLIDMVQLLLFFEADVNIPNEETGDSPLHGAIYSSSLYSEFDVESHHALAEIFNYSSKDEETPANTPAENATNLVRLLLYHDAEGDIKNNKEETPLHAAASTGNNDIVQALLNAQVDIDATDHLGQTALFVAIKYNLVSTVELLLENNANGDIPSLEEGSPLFMAMESKNFQIVKLLLEYKADLVITNQKHDSPLHFAVNTSNLDLLQLLLQHNANLNMQDSHGNTALHLAVKAGMVKFVELLVTAGAPLDVTNDLEETVLDVLDLELARVGNGWDFEVENYQNISEFISILNKV